MIGSDMLVRRLWSASESACRRRNVEAIYLDQWNEAKLASAGLALDRVIGPPPPPLLHLNHRSEEIKWRHTAEYVK